MTEDDGCDAGDGLLVASGGGHWERVSDEDRRGVPEGISGEVSDFP